MIFGKNADEKELAEKKAMQELDKEEEPKTISPQTQKSPDMVTIDRTVAESFMIAIEECVGDIQEQKALVDKLINDRRQDLVAFQSETIRKFNDLISATSGLKEKLKTTESYESYLEERVKNINLEKEVNMLQEQLYKEKAEFSQFIIKTSKGIWSGPLHETRCSFRQIWSQLPSGHSYPVPTHYHRG